MDEHQRPAAPMPPVCTNAANLAPAGKEPDAIPSPSPQQESPASLVRKRFGKFAAAHFCYTFFLNFCLIFLIATLFSLMPLYWPDWLLEGLFGWLLPLALMGGYALLGYWFGGKDVWPMPLRGRDLTWSILAEAAVAWCWAALIIGTFAAGSDLILILLYQSFFLALPSSAFVWMGLATLGFSEIGDLVCLGFWAGLLPPLLFHIGSYWRAWQAAQR